MGASPRPTERSPAPHLSPRQSPSTPSRRRCPSGAQPLSQKGSGTSATAKAPARPGTPTQHELPASIAVAGLLALGFLGRRSRRLRGVIAAMVLALVAGLRTLRLLRQQHRDWGGWNDYRNRDHDHDDRNSGQGHLHHYHNGRGHGDRTAGDDDVCTDAAVDSTSKQERHPRPGMALLFGLSYGVFASSGLRAK